MPDKSLHELSINKEIAAYMYPGFKEQWDSVTWSNWVKSNKNYTRDLNELYVVVEKWGLPISLYFRVDDYDKEWVAVVDIFKAVKCKECHQIKQEIRSISDECPAMALATALFQAIRLKSERGIE